MREPTRAGKRAGRGARTGADKAGGEGTVGSLADGGARARIYARRARLLLLRPIRQWAGARALAGGGRRGEAGEGKYARSRELDELRIALVCAERDWRDGGGIPLHAYEEDIADPEGREQAAARRLVTLQEPLRVPARRHARRSGGRAARPQQHALGERCRGRWRSQDLLGATVDLGGALAAAMEEAGQ